MNEPSKGRVTWHRTWVAAVVSAVVIWRAAAYWSPSPFVTIPDSLRLPHALLGFLFLFAGAWAWWRRPNQWTDLVLLYGVALGVHWGGTVGIAHDSLELGFFWVYLGFTALGDAAILNLAIVYPSGRPIAPKWRIALYAPALIVLMTAPIAAFMSRSALAPLAGLVLLVANLLSIAAGMVFLVRLFTVDRATRRASHLPLIVGGMFTGSIIALLGAAKVLPGVPEAWNLSLGLIPITLLLALVYGCREQAPMVVGEACHESRRTSQ